MYAVEWFPNFYAMGVTWDEFWKCTPFMLKRIANGHQEKVKEIDFLNWLNGKYQLSATAVAIDHCLNGRKASTEYVEKPFMEQIEESDTEKELQKKREAFVAGLMAMKANFEISHPKKNESGTN